MPRGCGPCNFCCKVLHIPDLEKPAGALCWNTGIHGGCAVQSKKPDPGKVFFDETLGKWISEVSEVEKDLTLLACAQFKCMWLASQERDDPGEVWPRHWRPDISHLMIGPRDPVDNTMAHVHVDSAHPTAWAEPEILAFFQRQMKRGVKYQIHLGEQRFMLEPSEA